MSDDLNTAKITGMILGGVIIAAVTGSYFGWIFMLLLGILHNDVSKSIPAPGYWACFLPAVFIRIFIDQGIYRDPRS